MKKFFILNNYCQIITPEIESYFFNYKLLNIFRNNNIEETFYLKNKILRTHTSCSQNRYFKNYSNKIKIFNIGKVYRNDFSKFHLFQFFQLDFFILKNNYSLKNVLYFLLKFLSFFLKKKIYYKIRKTRFPFTINSYEIDIFYNNLWIEIIGIGIINNNILINNKLKTLGFAGGIGIDRLIMIKKSKKHIKYIYD
nr:hypothetical protein [Candidatus Carsonella ruddii]